MVERLRQKVTSQTLSYADSNTHYINCTFVSPRLESFVNCYNSGFTNCAFRSGIDQDYYNCEFGNCSFVSVSKQFIECYFFGCRFGRLTAIVKLPNFSFLFPVDTMHVCPYIITRYLVLPGARRFIVDLTLSTMTCDYILGKIVWKLNNSYAFYQTESKFLVIERYDL